jgi:hypothetical protein
MKAHRIATALVLASLLAAAPAAARAWRVMRGARSLTAPGTARIQLELRSSGGSGCGGGGCNGGVEVRSVRGGALPTQQPSYFYSDRDDSPPGCPVAHERADLFSEWTEAEIAPARDGARLSCGIGFLIGETMHEWVILRTRSVPAQP